MTVTSGFSIKADRKCSTSLSVSVPLRERPGTYSVGNWHEQQPVHIAEVALQIPEKGKKTN